MSSFSSAIRKNDKIKETNFEIALAGNPNVGKSTIFNALTGLKQHTGNWTGKTVSNTVGNFTYNDYNIKLLDLPGVYSLFPRSEEEVIANCYLKNNAANCIIIVVDETNLERNLCLVLQILNITKQVLVCLNLCDEAKKKGIYIDTEELSLQLGVPVVETSAFKKTGIKTLVETAVKLSKDEIKTYNVKSIADCYSDNYDIYISNIFKKSKEICDRCLIQKMNKTDNTFKIDKIVTSKKYGIPIMLLMLGVIFWITIVGANQISELLSKGFEYLKLNLQYTLNVMNINKTLYDFLINGVYTTLSWVISVMLPPMAIFFPIFSLLEDSGFLPRIAFNLDSCFYKCGAHSKQALTMAMGFGCNACGVMGCRIIDSTREKNIAILTNSFIPCNGKLPTLIAITSIFIADSVYKFVNSIIITFVLVFLILISITLTFLSSRLLANTILRGEKSSFVLELPSYRKPKILSTIIYSFKDRAWFVLLRAITVAVPAGAIIWFMANLKINNVSLMNYCTDFFEPFGRLLGLDGVIIVAIILGLPANEIVLPIMLMMYTNGGTLTNYTSLSQLSDILAHNGWNITTALCFISLCLFHFPCSTTILTIYKETKSIKHTVLSMIIPTLYGLIICILINSLTMLISML